MAEEAVCETADVRNRRSQLFVELLDLLASLREGRAGPRPSADEAIRGTIRRLQSSEQKPRSRVYGISPRLDRALRASGRMTGRSLRTGCMPLGTSSPCR